MVGFGEAVGLFYKNYFNFNGRATRAEYWWPALMQLLIYSVLIIGFIVTAGLESDVWIGILVVIALIFAFGNLIPNYAVAARRFHDLDQTGWLVLVFVVVNGLIGLTWFAQMVWFAMPGTVGNNQYGPDPFGSKADIFI